MSIPLQTGQAGSPVPDGFPDDLPPALNVLMGVFLLYWKIDEVIDTIQPYPPLDRKERKLLFNLNKPRRMGELASEMQVLPSTLTATADELERKGFLRRDRDPSDRRAWLVSLTGDGQAARAQLIAQGARIFAETTGLEPDETETMSDLMLKVARNVTATGIPEGMKEWH